MLDFPYFPELYFLGRLLVIIVILIPPSPRLGGRDISELDKSAKPASPQATFKQTDSSTMM